MPNQQQDAVSQVQDLLTGKDPAKAGADSENRRPRKDAKQPAENNQPQGRQQHATGDDEDGNTEGTPRDEKRDDWPPRRIFDEDDDDAPADNDRVFDDDDSDDDSIDALAERLGVSRKELYKTKIPLGSGKFATLGELKDTFKKAGDLEERREALDKDVSTHRKAIIRAEAELTEIVKAMGPIDPRLRKAAAARLDSQIMEESKKLFRIMPEWQDEQTRKRDQGDIAKLLNHFGIPRGRIDTIIDHREWYFLHEMTKLAKRVERARKIDNGKAAPSGFTQASRSQSDRARAKPDAKPTTRDGKAEAVAKLIRGT